MSETPEPKRRRWPWVVAALVAMLALYVLAAPPVTQFAYDDVVGLRNPARGRIISAIYEPLRRVYPHLPPPVLDAYRWYDRTFWSAKP